MAVPPPVTEVVANLRFPVHVHVDQQCVLPSCWRCDGHESYRSCLRLQSDPLVCDLPVIVHLVVVHVSVLSVVQLVGLLVQPLLELPPLGRAAAMVWQTDISLAKISVQPCL